MWIIDNIVITKLGKNTGEAFVTLMDEDSESAMTINKIMIDLSDGAEPVQIARLGGVQVVTGAMIDQILEMILDIFTDAMDGLPPGAYVADADGINKM